MIGVFVAGSARTGPAGSVLTGASLTASTVIVIVAEAEFGTSHGAGGAIVGVAAVGDLIGEAVGAVEVGRRVGRAAAVAVRRRREDLVGQVRVGGLDVADERGEVERQRPVLVGLRLASSDGVSLTGSTVIDTVWVVEVSGASHAGAGAPQLSGSPRSMTR